MNEEKLSYEAGIQELEELVKSLETGEMTLEGSFQAYERTVALKVALEKLLDEGDKRILVLTGDRETEMNAEEIK